MVVQIQQKRVHIASIPIMSDRPITAIQVHMAFLTVIYNLQGNYKKEIPGILKAYEGMHRWIYQSTLSGGVDKLGNVHREWAQDNIRLDLENSAGHNLQSLY